MRSGVLLLAVLVAVPMTARADATLMERFLSTFGPDLPASSSGGPERGAVCATDLVDRLQQGAASLTPAERHLVDSTLDPFYRAWLAEGGATWEEGDVDSLRAVQRATCLTPAAIDFGPYEEVEETENFEVHWNLDGRTSPLAIVEIAGRLEAGLAILTEEQGWPQPPGLDTHEMLVVVEWMESNVFAWVSSATCPGQGVVPYMVINSRYFSDIEQVRSTLGHELFHAVQMRYPWPGFLDLDQNRWWKEATATYQQGLVYPDDSAPVLDHLQSWTRATWRSIETYDDNHQYGMVVLPLSIEGELGGPEWHRSFWEHLAESEAEDIPAALEEFLPGEGTDFRSAYSAYVARGATADYPRYPDAVAPHERKAALGGWVDNGTIADHLPGDYPTEDTVAADHEPPAPESLGTNYVWFGSEGIEGEQAVAVRFEGAGHVGAVETEWVVEYVAVRGGDPAERVSPELTWDAEAADGVGAWIADLQLEPAGDYDGLMLAVSPMGEFEGRAEYAYRGRVWPATGTGGLVEPGTDGSGCAGCGVAAAAPGPAWGVALLPLLRRRRRGGLRPGAPRGHRR